MIVKGGIPLVQNVLFYENPDLINIAATDDGTPPKILAQWKIIGETDQNRYLSWVYALITFNGGRDLGGGNLALAWARLRNNNDDIFISSQGFVAQGSYVAQTFGFPQINNYF